MTEKLLQFIWQFQHFNSGELKTEQGDELQVIYPGIYNTNQGPDFLEAKLLLDGCVWAGNVELHLKTSDWRKHAHDKDDNYRNIILHVVWENDEEDNCLYNLPTLELQSRVPKLMLEKYEAMMEENSFVPCQNNIHDVHPLVWLGWKERLLIERLHRKSLYVSQLLKESNYSWEGTLWWMLARNFGIKINAEAFEAIARSLPINILARHKNQLHQLEALLLGQAGLLHKDFQEDYPTLLWREYKFLAAKYKLKPVAIPVLFLRMRPSNFPSVRLAQLAMLVQHSSKLFSRIREAISFKELAGLLDITANDYWHYHYRFDEPGDYKPKALGIDMINNIIINTIAPMLFAYGIYYSDQQIIDKVIHWMEQLPSEKNVLIKGWNEIGIQSPYAYDGQALLELKTQYCDKKRCLDCAIGNAVLKRLISL